MSLVKPSPMSLVKRDPTPEQQAVIDRVVYGTNHVLVEALAGTGKTSTIVACLTEDLAARRIALCAFAKVNALDLQKEVETRVPASMQPRVSAHTLHSFGQGVLRSHGCLSNAVRFDKAGKQLVDEVADAIQQLLYSGELASVPAKATKSVPIPAAVQRNADDIRRRLTLAAGTSGQGYIPEDVRKASVTLLRRLKETRFTKDVAEADVEELGHEVDAFAGIDDKDVAAACAVVRFAYLHGANLQRAEIDFCDQIWLPLILKLDVRYRYDLVIVDEGQDISLPQFELAKRLMKNDGRLMIVGDLRQSIYGWRGAIGDQVWAEMREMRATVMPLTYSFRCAQSVVKLANQLVPELRARDGAPVGKVRVCSIVQLLVELPSVTSECFVLSRNNAALFQLALRLWRNQTRFNFRMMDDIVSGLRAIVRRLLSADDFREALEEWYVTERDKALKRREQEWVDRVEQQRAVLYSLLDYAEPRLLIKLIDDLALQPKSNIQLSTVHGTKGKECDCVYLLSETFARYRKNPNNDPIPQEELNLEYVAVTRAKLEVVWVVDVD
jgi:superfamily I DNA/RNA helicase